MEGRTSYRGSFVFGNQRATIQLTPLSPLQQQQQQQQQEQQRQHSAYGGVPADASFELKVSVDHKHVHVHTHTHTHRGSKPYLKPKRKHQRRQNFAGGEEHGSFSTASMQHDQLSIAPESHPSLVIATLSLVRHSLLYVTHSILHIPFLYSPIECVLHQLAARRRYLLQRYQEEQIRGVRQRLKSHAVEILDSDESDDESDPPAHMIGTHTFLHLLPAHLTSNPLTRCRSVSCLFLAARTAAATVGLAHHLHHARHNSLPTFSTVVFDTFSNQAMEARGSRAGDVAAYGDQSLLGWRSPTQRTRAMSKPTTPSLNAAAILALRPRHRPTLSAPADLREMVMQAHDLLIVAPDLGSPIADAAASSVVSSWASTRVYLLDSEASDNGSSLTDSEGPNVATASASAVLDPFSWGDYTGDFQPSGYVNLTRLLFVRCVLGLPPRSDGISRYPPGTSPWNLLRAFNLQLILNSSKLGSGHYGEVRLCVGVQGINGPVAIKSMQLRKGGLGGLAREVATSAEMSRLRSENTVPFHGCVLTRGPAVDCVYSHVITGVANGGTLDSYACRLEDKSRAELYTLRCNRNTRKERGYLKLFNRTSDGVSILDILLDVVGDCVALGGCGAIHNDIKSDNILVMEVLQTRPVPPHVRGALTDYGHAVYSFNTAAPGASLRITAPEGLPTHTRAGTCSPASDRYSFGFLIVQAVEFCAEPFARYAPEVMELALALLNPAMCRRPLFGHVKCVLQGARATMLKVLSESTFLYPASQLKQVFPRFPTVRLFPAPQRSFTSPCPPDAWLAFKSLGNYVTARNSVGLGIFRDPDMYAAVRGLPFFSLYNAFDAVGMAGSLAPFITGVCGYQMGGGMAPHMKDMEFTVLAVAKTMTGIKALQGLAVGNGPAAAQGREALDIAVRALMQEAS